MLKTCCKMCSTPHRFENRVLMAIRYISNFVDHNVQDFDMDYLCDERNFSEISTNIKRRKGPGDIEKVVRLNQLFKKSPDDETLKQSLIEESLLIPNKCHPDTFSLSGEPKIVNRIGGEIKKDFKPQSFENISKKLNLTKTENLTNLTGGRSYFLLDQLAALEEALIHYTVDNLLKFGFQLISVPDILPRAVIESCGMMTRGERTQVYRLDELLGNDLCLSGTAEMGIANMLRGKTFSSSNLPVRYAAVSRCFRAETSKIAEEKGLYRVHSFTKVEMFGVSNRIVSDSMLSEFVSIEERLFSSLGLHLRTLEMPPEELGAQAYRKYDIEAWLVGKERWAELSSASNCTDFQTRRLNMTTIDSLFGKYPHTLNGTAAAIPRLIIAIVETHQNSDGSVTLPQVLLPYLNFSKLVKSSVPNMAPYKGRTFYP